MIGPLRPYFEAEVPTRAQAELALRLVFLGVFGAQVVVAFAVGLGIAAAVPSRPRPNDAFAVVLLVMGAAHLPLGWLLAAAARHAGGKQAAMSSTILSAVLLSVPAWFAALLVVSAQRPLYLLVAAALLSLAYALGFLATGRAAVAAGRPPPDTAAGVAAGGDGAGPDDRDDARKVGY